MSVVEAAFESSTIVGFTYPDVPEYGVSNHGTHYGDYVDVRAGQGHGRWVAACQDEATAKRVAYLLSLQSVGSTVGGDA